jgi:hypothetical protein
MCVCVGGGAGGQVWKIFYNEEGVSGRALLPSVITCVLLLNEVPCFNCLKENLKAKEKLVAGPR